MTSIDTHRSQRPKINASPKNISATTAAHAKKGYRPQRNAAIACAVSVSIVGYVFVASRYFQRGYANPAIRLIHKA